jgi:hypothetical protein
MNLDNERPKPEREPRTIDLDKLRQRRVCKRRYGRATLTILRWGGLGLFGDPTLTQALALFRAGNSSTGDLAWAFVRSRVSSHSPSFNFADADLERLIELVTDCSRSPRFKAKTAEALANELVAAQDREREQMKELSEQFSRSLSGVTNLSKFFQPQILRWAEEQRKAMAALSKTFATPRLGALGAISTPTINEQITKLGLTASIREEMFPTLLTMKTHQLATTPSVALLGQRIRLPNTIAQELSNSLSRSLGGYSTQTVPPTLAALAREGTATVGDVVRAADEAADLAEEKGDAEEAQELRAVSAEVVVAAETPSVQKFEEMVAHLTDRINQRFDKLEDQNAANEERRQSDRRDDTTLSLFLWFLAIYLALFLFLIEHVPNH